MAEMKQGLLKHGLPADNELDKIFSNMDRDGSGALDYTEFLAATLNHQEQIQEDVCWSTFKTFDNDNSGYITHDELRLALTEGTLCDVMQISDDELGVIMADADLDGDGKISFEEFMAMMRGLNDGKGPQGLLRGGFGKGNFIIKNEGTPDEKYEMKGSVGEGATASVLKCAMKSTGAMRAMKHIGKHKVKNVQGIQ